MKISTLLVALIFFVMVITSGGSMLVGSGSLNPAFIDSASYQTFNNTFNQRSNVDSAIENIRASLQHKNPSLLDMANLIYQGAVLTVFSVFGSIGFVFDAITGIPTVLGFSAELSPFLWAGAAILTVVVIFAILSVTLYREM